MSSPPTRPRLVPQLLLFAGLAGFALLAWALERWGGVGVHGAVPALYALPLVAIPAALWLTFFYLQDVHEPEPTHVVVGVFLLGALVAQPLSRGLVEELFHAHEWPSLGGHLALEAARALLVVAAAQELCKYVVVRYSVYLSAEFNEPMDGIVYMTAAGIGFATAQNFHELTHESSLALSVGAIHVVITTLAHACFAGTVGYALGYARFSVAASDRVRRQLVLVLGYLAAVTLNGGFALVEARVTRRGLDFRPWMGLAAAAAFATVVFGLLAILTRRHLDDSPHAPTTATAEASS